MWFEWVKDWGYLGVGLLMAMESSIFPVPSELVVPPAAIMAAQGEMNIWGVIAASTIGSWVGSAITYYVSRVVGRPVIMRWGKYFFMPSSKVEQSERFLERYEVGGVFFARLLPVMRHLISIPAGIIRMKFLTFSIVTTVGAFIWSCVLAWYGFRIGENNPDLLKDPDALMSTIKAESWPIIIAVAVLALLYFVMLKMSAKKTSKNTPDECV